MPVIPWLDTLPSVNRDNPQSGYYIYTGYVAGGFNRNNCVVLISEGKLTLVEQERGLVWYYNVENDVIDIATFDADKSTIPPTVAIISKAGLQGLDAKVIKVIPNITKNDIGGKITPTEEVSGQNNLNSYEDELTDI